VQTLGSQTSTGDASSAAGSTITGTSANSGGYGTSSAAQPSQSSGGSGATVIPSTTESGSLAGTPTATANIILQIVPGNAGGYRRQAASVYLTLDSDTTNCSSATIFTLANGELSSGGNLVSTDTGTLFQPFDVSSVVLGITRLFTVQNNFLFWSSGGFAVSPASFCQTPNRQVYALFAGPTNAAYPASCNAVSLLAIDGETCPTFVSYQRITNDPDAASNCVNGVIIVPGGGASRGGGAGGSEGASGIPSGPNQVLPPNIFPIGSALPGQFCVTITTAILYGATSYESMSTAPAIRN
jgi:hypothetical protein